MSTEQLLRDGLAGLGERISVPAGLGLAAHRRWRRGRAGRRTLLGGVAAASAGVLALTMASGSGAGVAERPAGYVTRQVDAAMSAADAAGLVEYTVTTFPRGQGPGLLAASPSYSPEWASPRYTRPVLERWDYRGRDALRFYGSPGEEIFAGVSTTTAKGFTVTFATYSQRTWWHEAVTWRFPSPTADGVLCDTSPQDSTVPWPSQVRDLLACRNIVVDNTSGPVAGQRAIELSAWVPHAGTWHLWVNPATYLPIQYLFTGPHVMPTPVTFRWLRPTGASLAPFGLSVPRGYRRVLVPVG